MKTVRDKCPSCGSHNVSNIDTQWGGENCVIEKCICDDCNALWEEIFLAEYYGYCTISHDGSRDYYNKEGKKE